MLTPIELNSKTIAPNNKLFTSGLLTFKKKCRNTKESGRKIFSQENCSPVLFRLHSFDLFDPLAVSADGSEVSRGPTTGYLSGGASIFFVPFQHTESVFRAKTQEGQYLGGRASLIGGSGNRRIIYARNDSFFSWEFH